MDLQSIALWATIGVLLNAVGFPWDTWQFWAFIGLFMCVQTISLKEGRREGITSLLDLLPEEEQNRIRELAIKQLKQMKEE